MIEYAGRHEARTLRVKEVISVTIEAAPKQVVRECGSWKGT